MKFQALILSLALATGVNAHADKTFREKHPRRAEVDRRIRRQDKRIANGLASGKLTAAQAQTLQGQEAGVKAQMQADAKANGGHLTKSEERQLNQELNQDSKQIYGEKH